jgi:hypothetical protein
MPYCRACEGVLCGACGDWHGLDLAPPDFYSADQENMGADCAAWWSVLRCHTACIEHHRVASGAA